VGAVCPDCTYVDAAGNVLAWEHLNMLDRPDCRAWWERRRQWYEVNGFFTRREAVQLRGDRCRA